MLAEYLIHDDINVIVMSWVTGSGPPYAQACANIRLIGSIVGQFIIDLNVSRQINGISVNELM